MEKTVKTVCNPLIAVGAAAAMAAVWPGKMFGDDAVSVAFYMAGIAIAAVILFYAVNHNRTGLATVCMASRSPCRPWTAAVSASPARSGRAAII